MKPFGFGWVWLVGDGGYSDKVGEDSK